jgi:hypothetical protein
MNHIFCEQEARKCFEEALERATVEAKDDERYYKLIAITIRYREYGPQKKLGSSFIFFFCATYAALQLSKVRYQ